MENTGLMGKILSFLLLLACVAGFAKGPSLPYGTCFHLFIGVEGVEGTPPDWWISGIAPRPVNGTRLDKLSLQRWVDAQPTQMRPIFQRLADNVREVSQEEFERELKRSFEKLLSETPQGSKLVFLIDTDEVFDRPKSGLWATTLVRELFKERSSDFKFIRTSEVPLIETHLRSGEYRLVIVQDAIYSGNQMGNLVDRVKTSAPIYVVSPYCRTDSLAVIQGKKAIETPEIKFYSTVAMSDVAEVTKGFSGVHAQYLKAILNHRGLIRPHQTLTLFAHKVADSISFPAAVSHGHVYTTDSLGLPMFSHKSIPFLKLRDEPYRRPR